MIIFLADDDKDDRSFFYDAIKEIPVSVEVQDFTNGVELMDSLYSKKSLPEAIFLDLNMPLMNGFECLEDIREQHTFDNIAVIIYSTSFHKEDLQKLKNLGATRYLRKPSSFNVLKTLIYNCLQDIKNSNHNMAGDADFIVPK